MKALIFAGLLFLGLFSAAFAQQADKATCLAVFEAGAVAFHYNNVSNFGSGTYHSQDQVMGYMTNGLRGVPDNVSKAATTAVGLAYDNGMTPDEFVVSDPYQCFTATDPAILDYKKAWTEQIGVNPGS